MDPIGLVQFRHAAYAFQQEGNEVELVAGCESPENFFESVRIGLPHAGGDLHAGQDEAGGGVFCLYFIEDGLQVLFGCGKGDAP